MGKPRDERTTRTQDGRFALFEVAPSGPDLGVAELNMNPKRRPGRFQTAGNEPPPPDLPLKARQNGSLGAQVPQSTEVVRSPLA